jgi:hypothetical protein
MKGLAGGKRGVIWEDNLFIKGISLFQETKAGKTQKPGHIMHPGLNIFFSKLVFSSVCEQNV